MNSINNFSDILNRASTSNIKKVVLAAAHDENALGAIVGAVNREIVEMLLVGDKEKILRLAKKNNLKIESGRIIDECDVRKAAEISVRLVKEKKADVLMKGNLPTSVLLKAVLNKDFGLRKGDLLSHIAVFELEGSYHKLLALTDAAMNIAPVLKEKIAIVNNSIEFMHSIGVLMPKIAALAAVEVVNENMPATVDAAILAKMSERKQFKGCIVDGPLAFDNAFSKKSAEYKGVVSQVAGDVDVLFVQNIEAANILYKSLVYAAKAKCAAVVVGASAPIILTSRADSDETKFNSIALAAAIN